ncbi:MAG: ribbon-helix-helix domain-containing protein [Rhodospirillales bacterium]
MQKRSVTVAGHATSVALEPAFWRALETIAARRGKSLAALIREIDETRTGAGTGPLAGAIRIFVLEDALSRNGGNSPEKVL